MELFVRTRNGMSSSRSLRTKSAAPGIACSSRTSTPSMSISHELIVGRVTRAIFAGATGLATAEGASMSLMRARLSLLTVLVACAAVPTASAANPEQALAERYAPVVRLVEHTDCAPGKPFLPIDVNLLFDEPTVALRGPWGNDLVKIAPSAKDLAGLFEYHLDFPGSALDPGCSYLTWERRLVEGHSPTVYAHVATDPAHPGKLALQYWLFYVFNDWNNLHEGDWEMIQLDFDAPTAAKALEHPPVAVGYSQHEGAERAAWGDEKLELVSGTHPVVHPAVGSHANFFGEALYLGSSSS